MCRRTIITVQTFLTEGACGLYLDVIGDGWIRQSPSFVQQLGSSGAEPGKEECIARDNKDRRSSEDDPNHQSCPIPKAALIVPAIPSVNVFILSSDSASTITRARASVPE